VDTFLFWPNFLLPKGRLRELPFEGEIGLLFNLEVMELLLRKFVKKFPKKGKGI